MAFKFINNIFKKSLQTDESKTTIIIRLTVGVIFLSEGVQKFLFPTIRGAGRFEKIGLPYPDFLGSFVGSIEIICGILILIGLFTRLASLLTLFIMIVSLMTTKYEIFTNEGFWIMMHKSRTDWAMLLGSLFLIINGGGFCSLDKRIITTRLSEC